MKYALLGSLMACVLLAGLCGAAAAAEKKFNHFSIDLPAKCSATEKESIVTVSCGQDSFFSIGIFTKAETGNMTPKRNRFLRAGFILFHWYFYQGGNR